MLQAHLRGHWSPGQGCFRDGPCHANDYQVSFKPRPTAHIYAHCLPKMLLGISSVPSRSLRRLPRLSCLVANWWPTGHQHLLLLLDSLHHCTARRLFRRTVTTHLSTLFSLPELKESLLRAHCWSSQPQSACLIGGSIDHCGPKPPFRRRWTWSNAQACALVYHGGTIFPRL